MIPVAFAELPALPLTARGKLDRRALPAPALAPAHEPTPPRTLLEMEIASIWAAVLGTDRIGAHDDFFLLGGHSLAAMRVMARVTQRLGVELSLAHRPFFEHPSVAEVAAVVERLAATRQAARASGQQA